VKLTSENYENMSFELRKNMIGLMIWSGFLIASFLIITTIMPDSIFIVCGFFIYTMAIIVVRLRGLAKKVKRLYMVWVLDIDILSFVENNIVYIVIPDERRDDVES
jgi:hypothetical protein